MNDCRWPKAVRLVCGACVLATQLQACLAPAAGSQEPDMGIVLSQEPDVTPPAEISMTNGLFTRGQASRGERRFQQLCEACHRTNEITRGWFGGAIYQTAGDLLEVISTTMPEDNPGSLNPEEYVDILAFLLRMNDYPTGEEALPADLSLLESIRIPGP